MSNDDAATAAALSSGLEAMIASTDRPIKGERLSGRVAIISGAGSSGELIGVGSATALVFAAQGASVGVLDRDHDRALNTVRLIEHVGGRAIAVEGDITDIESCHAAVAAVVKAYGRLDIVVNNAAIARPGDAVSVTQADWREVIDVCLTGAMQLTQAGAPDLARQGGAIVNISSIAGMRGFGSAAYSAAKAGLEGLTRDTAVALGRRGIRTNCIVVGFIRAPMAGGGAEARDRRRLASPLGTEGSAWDIAFGALYMASEEARWVNGTCLPIDAGVTIAGPLVFA